MGGCPATRPPHPPLAHPPPTRPSRSDPSTPSHPYRHLRAHPSRHSRAGGNPPGGAASLPRTTPITAPSSLPPHGRRASDRAATAQRPPATPAIRPWRLRRDGSTLSPCVTRPPPAPPPWRPHNPPPQSRRAATRRGSDPPKSNQIANPTPKLPPRPQKQTTTHFALPSFRKRKKTPNYPPKLNIQTRPADDPAVATPQPSPHKAVAQRPVAPATGNPGWGPRLVGSA